ncbi:MAG TPA: AraC family transcriptional regulator [Rhizomicrobium sp.]|nr:AraC family transcriptional regulator [Rhizomicrobium sp.]
MPAARTDRIVRAPGALDRIDARLAGAAYTPHRHDTYAIGITLEGVQSFDYRGKTRSSLPGQVVVLHPDELHDGRAGDGTVFRYRTAYIAPVRIQDALGGRPLPFIREGVCSDARLRRAVSALLDDFEHPLSELEEHDALTDLAHVLAAVAGRTAATRASDRRAALAARDYIEAHLIRNISLRELERETRRDRWQLSRDFRATFGTSPYRYLTARRLDRARRMMLEGGSTAGIAISCGFSDQSHFGRLFKKTFGLTPNAWLRAQGAHNRSIKL